ncbi:MAG: baseplate J/gp47 family protein [Chloroflexota bacterium]
MPLSTPPLDDRSFDQLVDDAIRLARTRAPSWTDMTTGDPGITLLELFAFLTETLIYRLNRLPDKVYVELLRLLGVRLRPPVAAMATLTFSRNRAAPPGPIEIPRGTRVTIQRPGAGADAPVFLTDDVVTLAADKTSVDVEAHHAEQVLAELLGTGTGQAGLSLRVARAPIIAPTGDALDLVVGVEALRDELTENDEAIQFDGRSFRLWREVDDFSSLETLDAPVYVADRLEGRIDVAPAADLGGGAADGGADTRRALGAVPAAGREIRAWYRRGGGATGNVGPGTLVVLKDPIPALDVTNAAAARGGRDAETLENGLARGPYELHSPRRAVTARDYERVAEDSDAGIVRSRAITQAELWRYAAPGTVEVLIVPGLGDEGASPAGITAGALEALQTDAARRQVESALEERRPLGTSSVVSWARYKTVRVAATIVVHRAEVQEAVRQRVDERLHLTVNPLPTADNAGGWPFGRSLYRSNVDKIILSEPAVRYARGVQLIVDEVPDADVLALERDPWQASTWYAGSGGTMFRSVNDGDGWEAMDRFADEVVQDVRAHPDRPGLVAASTDLSTGSTSRVRMSFDSGGTWRVAAEFAFGVQGLAWITRDGEPILFVATDRGLYQLGTTEGSDPVQVLVDPADQKKGFFAVVASRQVQGDISVAAAAQTGGVWLSKDGGASFADTGLHGFVRSLAVQYDGPRAFVWAGMEASGGDPGTGANRWELRGREDPPDRWVHFGAGWAGGTCWSLASRGRLMVAGTHEAGVAWLDTGAPQPTWQTSGPESGLPPKAGGEFVDIRAVAADPDGVLLLVGGERGVFRTSEDAPAHYANASEHVFVDEVTVPPTWLLVCGANEIEVRTDAPGRD